MCVCVCGFECDLWFLWFFSKGISASALPYKRTPPSWLKISPQDVLFQNPNSHSLSVSVICVFVCHFWWVLMEVEIYRWRRTYASSPRRVWHHHRSVWFFVTLTVSLRLRASPEARSSVFSRLTVRFLFSIFGVIFELCLDSEKFFVWFRWENVVCYNLIEKWQIGSCHCE